MDGTKFSFFGWTIPLNVVKWGISASTPSIPLHHGPPTSSLTPFLFFISPIQGFSQALMREISFHFPGQAQANTPHQGQQERPMSEEHGGRAGSPMRCFPAQPNTNLLTNGNYIHSPSHLTFHGCQNEFGQRSVQLSNNLLCELVTESFNHLLSESAQLSHTRFSHFLTN